MTSTQALSEQDVLSAIAAMLATVLEDIGLDDVEITMATRFTDDLELESIDLVTLAGELQETWGEQVNFAEFLAGMELEQIIALSVGDLVGYVVAQLAGGG